MNRHETLIPLLEHHAERAERGEQYNAIANCHADGMDSIVLHDEPGNRVRMFFADWHHVLHRNRNGEFSIAIHAHHCDIRLVGLFGAARNDVYAITPHPSGPFAEMAYSSGVSSESSLLPTGQRAFAHLLRSELLEATVKLRAHEMHTIHLAEDVRAAWLVIEGAEDAEYRSVCWSNAKRPFDPSGLYQPMDSAAVAKRLREVLSKIAGASA